jgi:hypothetical protein
MNSVPSREQCGFCEKLIADRRASRGFQALGWKKYIRADASSSCRPADQSRTAFNCRMAQRFACRRQARTGARCYTRRHHAHRRASNVKLAAVGFPQRCSECSFLHHRRDRFAKALINETGISGSAKGRPELSHPILFSGGTAQFNQSNALLSQTSQSSSCRHVHSIASTAPPSTAAKQKPLLFVQPIGGRHVCATYQ